MPSLESIWQTANRWSWSQTTTRKCWRANIPLPGPDLGAALDWAAQRASASGFDRVTVGCEPTGHRWRVLGRLAADRGMALVCVQPSMISWSRRAEDLTCDKTDENDAVLIARLTAQLRCYVPEPGDQIGQSKFVEHVHHSGFGVGKTPFGFSPVT